MRRQTLFWQVHHGNGQEAVLPNLKLVTFTNRLRRAAKRGGLQIIKTRTPAPGSAPDAGYMLVKAGTSKIVVGKHFSATLDDIRRALSI